MIKKLTFVFAIAGLVMSSGVAQDKDTAVEKKAAPAQVARQTAEATWPEGKLTLSYGSPAWKDEYKAKATEAGFVWRFGNNQWTTATLTSGLDSAQGAIPPGDYSVALRSGADGKWDLLFYEANAFYDKAFKTWEIKGGTTAELKTPKPNFSLRFDDKKLIAEFGPLSASWTLKPIKVNPPVDTEFANVGARFEILALPLAGATFKDTTIGVVTATLDSVKARYHIKLTADGDKATLNMVNERAGYVAKEKESLETIVKRIGEMLGEHPERKDMAEPILAGFKTVIDADDAMLKKFERLKPAATVEGTVAKRDSAATELGLSHDRPKFAIVLKLALANSDASFEVKPREMFTKPRERKAE
jgi:Protein of unknown function (DUF2911)